MYKIPIKARTGEVKVIEAYGMELDARVSRLNSKELSKVRESFDLLIELEEVCNPEGNIDLLIGSAMMAEFPEVISTNNDTCVIMSSCYGTHNYFIAGQHRHGSDRNNLNKLYNVQVVEMTHTHEEVYREYVDNLNAKDEIIRGKERRIASLEENCAKFEDILNSKERNAENLKLSLHKAQSQIARLDNKLENKVMRCDEERSRYAGKLNKLTTELEKAEAERRKLQLEKEKLKLAYESEIESLKGQLYQEASHDRNVVGRGQPKSDKLDETEDHRSNRMNILTPAKAEYSKKYKAEKGPSKKGKAAQEHNLAMHAQRNPFERMTHSDTLIGNVQKEEQPRSKYKFEIRQETLNFVAEMNEKKANVNGNRQACLMNHEKLNSYQKKGEDKPEAADGRNKLLQEDEHKKSDG